MSDTTCNDFSDNTDQTGSTKTVALAPTISLDKWDRFANSHRRLAKNQWDRQFVMLLATIAVLAYLGYRLFWTLNLETPFSAFLSIGLLCAETWMSFLLFLYFVQVWKLEEPPARKPIYGKSVDIFITTYNEPEEILRETVISCNAIDYPHETFLLDDGNRDSIRLLAEELGVKYIARPNHDCAKAGNLNYAMQQTSGEFIVILDADHVPFRHLIDRMIGYFDDPKMGYVQSPHSVYNFDNVSGDWSPKTQQYWEDVNLFHYTVQLGRNHWNAACFCGSAVMFRRSALESVGNFATETVTEDLHTGLRIIAKGWKSLAISEPLIVGQAPEDIHSFNTQRVRWGQGNLSVMHYDNPLTMKGLTIAQRLNYLGAILNWTIGIPLLFTFLVPILVLFTTVSPIKEVTPTYLILLAAYLGSFLFAIEYVSGKAASLLGIQVNLMSNFHAQVKATFKALFRKKHSKFIVTPKIARQSQVQTRGWNVFKAIAPQLMIIAAGITAIFWAGLNLVFGLVDYPAGFIAGSVVMLFFIWLAIMSISKSLRCYRRKRAWHYPAVFPVTFNLDSTSDAKSEVISDTNSDVNSDANFVNTSGQKAGYKEAANEAANQAANQETGYGVSAFFNDSEVEWISSTPLNRGDRVELELTSPINTVKLNVLVTGLFDIRAGKRDSRGWFYRGEIQHPNNEQLAEIENIALKYVSPLILEKNYCTGEKQWLSGFFQSFIPFGRMICRCVEPVHVPFTVVVDNDLLNESVLNGYVTHANSKTANNTASLSSNTERNTADNAASAQADNEDEVICNKTIVEHYDTKSFSFVLPEPFPANKKIKFNMILDKPIHCSLFPEKIEQVHIGGNTLYRYSFSVESLDSEAKQNFLHFNRRAKVNRWGRAINRVQRQNSILYDTKIITAGLLVTAFVLAFVSGAYLYDNNDDIFMEHTAKYQTVPADVDATRHRLSSILADMESHHEDHLDRWLRLYDAAVRVRDREICAKAADVIAQIFEDDNEKSKAADWKMISALMYFRLANRQSEAILQLNDIHLTGGEKYLTPSKRLEYYLMRARTAANEDDPKTMERFYREAMYLNPGNAKVMEEWLNALLVMKKKYDTVRNAPDHEKNKWVNEYELVIEEFQTMVKALPQDNDMVSKSAMLSEATHQNIPEAISSLKQLSTDSPLDIEDQKRLIRMLVHEKRYQEAIPQIIKLDDNIPDTVEFRHLFTWSVLPQADKLSDYEKDWAKKRMLSLIQGGEKTDYVDWNEDDFMMTTDFLEVFGMLNDHEAFLRAALKHIPKESKENYDAIDLKLAIVLRNQKRFTEAEPIFEELLEEK
ncbi:MAG: glycosyltransferase [Thermoguttaceae bacterium]